MRGAFPAYSLISPMNTRNLACVAWSRVQRPRSRVAGTAVGSREGVRLLWTLNFELTCPATRARPGAARRAGLGSRLGAATGEPTEYLLHPEVGRFVSG